MTTDRDLLKQVAKIVGARKETLCTQQMLQCNAQAQPSKMHQNQANENQASAFL